MIKKFRKDSLVAMKVLMSKGINIYRQYKMPILYIIFGGLTTLVNIVVYFVCYNVAGLSNVFSTIIAWILSVIFAFITNKFYVFESKSKNLFYEISTFFGCRFGTGILDVGIMYLTVDILNWNALLMKIISNIIVIVLNYILSKVIIFKKKA